MSAYRMVGASDATNFENMVNGLLAQGWVAQGGVSVTYVPHPIPNQHGSFQYYQAMIKP